MTIANVNVRQILLKRGNTTQSTGYTGPVGELTLDTDLDTVRVHDGVTAGGVNILATQAQINALTTTISTITGVDGNLLANAATQQTQINNITSGVTLFGNIVPSANITYSLGNVTHQWKELWVSNSTIYLGGIPLSVVDGNLYVNGSAISNGTAPADTGDVGFSGAVIYNKTDYNQGIYVAPGGESTSYVFVPGNMQSDTSAVQIVNGSTGGIELNSNNNYWSFQPNGVLGLPNNVKQVPTPNTQCLPNVDTVVYTGTDQWQHTIKLLLQAEGVEEGLAGQWDTQSAEMIIAKSFLGDKVAASLYGRVYTSVNPLATFTAQWNATTSRVEVTCRPTSTSNPVYVRTFATEITTSD